MEKRILKKACLYRHYKNKWYFVLDVSIHSETREEFVTYFPLYTNEIMLFVRPKEMFLEEIDDKEYIDFQKERFLEVDRIDISESLNSELVSKVKMLLRTIIL